MKKTTFLVGVVLGVVIIGSSSTTAHAFDLSELKDSSPETTANTVLLAAADNTKIEKPTTPKPVRHTVKEGESLSKIAKLHGTTWTRLFDKNTQLTDPDIISVNMVLDIPKPDEKLAERKLPATEPAAQTPTQTERTSQTAPSQNQTNQRPPQSSRQANTQPRGASAGNRYSAGYCTWYVKNRRPDMPNNLGNANTWVSRARAQGMATGSSPRVGAVGQQGMHVVYVEAVHANGTVTISEMNFRGLYVTSTRTVPASSFQYIY